MARQQYDARLAERMIQAREQAWAAMPPKAALAMGTAARRTVEGARTAADYTAPKVGSAMATTRSVAGPAMDGAVLRGAAALHALRGQVSAARSTGWSARADPPGEGRTGAAGRGGRRVRPAAP